MSVLNIIGKDVIAIAALGGFTFYGTARGDAVVSRPGLAESYFCLVSPDLHGWKVVGGWLPMRRLFGVRYATIDDALIAAMDECLRIFRERGMIA